MNAPENFVEKTVDEARRTQKTIVTRMAMSMINER